MVTKQDVLDEIAVYGNMLGPEKTGRLAVSDEWGDARTMVVLLLKSPEDRYYRSCLDEPDRRKSVFDMVRCLMSELDRGES